MKIMCNDKMIKKCKLYDEMRIVWLRHVWWTREVILAIALDAPWTTDSTNKLLKNPQEMSDVFAPYIKSTQQKIFVDLFTTHLKLGGDIVSASKKGETKRVEELQTQWHQNADQIARFMASLLLCLCEDDVRRMMYTHLHLTTQEATQVLNKQYEQGIATFDRVQKEALMMADYFASGIVHAKF